MTLPQVKTSEPQGETLLALLLELVNLNHVNLVNQYHQTLRQTLFTNHTRVHPSSLKNLAAAEVDALLDFLREAKPGTEHGIHLCQVGLSKETVLQLNQVTRRFFLACLDNDQILPALDLIETYLNEIIQGFIQQLNTIILDEQEQIRSALQVAVSRYVVEIKEVQSLAEQATEANKFKSQFIARISHELRTPLGAVLGMAEMLQENIYGPLNSQQQDITQRIINNAHVLKQVFTELLDQSQIESGKLKLRNESFSPRQIVEDIYSNYLPIALQKGLTVQLEMNPNLPSVAQGDPVRVQQVISNLVMNAIKYTETGGAVIHSQRASSTEWSVQVKDTGIGISDKNQAYIFDSFHQVDESGGWKFGGVGLGLAIVHNLVTAMGGHVTVESKIGKGSTFTVFFPLHATQMEDDS